MLDFLLAVGKKVLEFIFEGAMMIAGPIGMQIVGIVRKIGDTFNPLRPSVTLSIGPPVLFPASRYRVPFRGSVRLRRLEGLRHDRQVLVAESLVDDLLPFVGQASERGEVIFVGRLEREAHVLERE